MNAHLELVVPGLLDAQCAESDIPDLPGLAALLQRSSRVEGRAKLTELLADLLEQDTVDPAILSARGDGLNPEEGNDWFHCDPVTLHADRDRLMLFDGASISPGAEEAKQLCEHLNASFEEEGLRFHAPVASRWYLHWPAATDLETTALDQVVARPVDDFLPTGGSARLWQRYLSEIEMLLHAHDCNEARMARGEHCINSLWIWGESVELSHRSLGRTFDHVFSDDPMMKSAAQSLGIAHTGSPDSLASAMEQGQSLFLHLDHLRDAAVYGDSGQWQQNIGWLDEHWFVPLMQLLEQGDVASIRLHSLDGRQWLLDRSAGSSLLGRLKARFRQKTMDIRPFIEP